MRKTLAAATNNVTYPGGTDTDAMQKMMRTTTFNTPTGQLQFNDQGDLTDFEFVVYNFHSDGSKTEAK